jgi:glycine/D-amino acid oxidase-like deaminating enzyme
LQPLLFDRTPEIANFELKNCAAVADYIKKHDVACEYRQVTGCRTFWTEPLLAEAAALVEALHKEAPDIGKGVSTIMNAEDLKSEKVKPNCPGATMTEGAGSLWPYKLVTHVVRNLVKEQKINLQTNTPVESIHPLQDSQQPEARWTVNTPRGAIAAKHVILATNAYSSHLLPSFSDLIVPVRGTMTALLPPKGSKRLPDSYGFVGAGPGANPNSDDYLIQRPFEDVPNPRGHLMFGGGRTSGERNSMNETDDLFVDEGSVAYLQKTLLTTLDLGGQVDGISDLEAEYKWSGIMGYSRDNAPWVGAIPDTKGLWLCAGYTGHGMPNATLCANAVVQMLLLDDEGVDLIEAQKSLIEKGQIPSAYAITKERVAEANGLPSVREQDESDIMGYSSNGKWVVKV